VVIFRYPSLRGFAPQRPNKVKIANAIFLNHLISQALPYRAYLNIHSVKPFWHGFCICGGERRAKTMPTPSGPGHCRPVAQINIYSLHRYQSAAICPSSGTFGAMLFFPGRGVPVGQKM